MILIILKYKNTLINAILAKIYILNKMNKKQIFVETKGTRLLRLSCFRRILGHHSRY